LQRHNRLRATEAQLEAAVAKSNYAGVPPTDFGHLVKPFTGRSYPIEGVGGVYRKPNGEVVVVKPVVDEEAALAEIEQQQLLDKPQRT
jgi:hypothetical protein